ncbi:hypothetical protein K388_01938 [Streptomyces sp. KhCrAH-43]|uniref:hypothetical protein n=1 Tax=unclassified Streptomyces TaxID=2593676 RepID=UPI00037F789F|nr:MULTISPECIES: hypothetical protein [unclassified Streptomyces]MYS34938.1 hypothetical protein [Streptomyces sp. SID4920]MYX65285.1 hypothetical protein [Streptomyces sp. SID8373]RAJ64743.1 hypothetical protein K388_01938 [Streptomyces sp. KhCrAH-43]
MGVPATKWLAGMRITAERLAARDDQSGIALVTWTSGTAGQWVEVSVTFPLPYPSAPTVVQVTPQSSIPAVGGSTTLMWGASGVSATGFTLRAFRSTAISNQQFGWSARF